jgi:hypothetical protein
MKKEWKILSYKEKSHEIENLCKEESTKVSVRFDAEFAFDHYDSKLQAVYVRQLESSGRPVEFHMLVDLQADLQKLNPRLVMGILWTDDWELEEEEYPSTSQDSGVLV